MIPPTYASLMGHSVHGVDLTHLPTCAVRSLHTHPRSSSRSRPRGERARLRGGATSRPKK